MYSLPAPRFFRNSWYQWSSALIPSTSGRQLSFRNTNFFVVTDIATNPRVARPVGDFGIEVGHPTMYTFVFFPSRTDTLLLGYLLGSPTLSNNLENMG